MVKNMIPAQQFIEQQVAPNCKYGGFYPETGTFEPFKDYYNVSDILDAIAAAVEAGAVDRNAWVSQFFADREVFDRWMEEFADYSACYHIRDRWYYALMRVAGTVNEEGFVTSDEIAERLMRKAEETGQL